MNIQPADYLVHFSNGLLLVAYSVRDILWLRWFSVAAALTNIPCFLVQGTILWPPILWALVFIAINLYQITRVYMEGRPVVAVTDVSPFEASPLRSPDTRPERGALPEPGSNRLKSRKGAR